MPKIWPEHGRLCPLPRHTEKDFLLLTKPLAWATSRTGASQGHNLSSGAGNPARCARPPGAGVDPVALAERGRMRAATDVSTLFRTQG